MGNPIKSEGAAFRWLVAVVASAAFVILVAVLISSVAAAIVGFLLIAFVTVLIAKGMLHMLGSPDEDEEQPAESQSPPGDSTRPD